MLEGIAAGRTDRVSGYVGAGNRSGGGGRLRGALAEGLGGPLGLRSGCPRSGT